MRQPDYADRVFRHFYPNIVAGDPKDLHDFGNMFLVPEVESALSRYYGSVTGADRRRRKPGIDYNDRAWRMRLCQPPFQYHKELFQVFDRLRLTAHTINQMCTWWGTKAEVDAWSFRHPGRIDEDDVFDTIPKIHVISLPRAIFPDEQAKTQKRRSSRIRRLFERPRGITSFRELHQNAQGDNSSDVEPRLSSEEAMSPNYEDEEDVVANSFGANLNQELHAGLRNTEFEDWLKEEAESGRLPSTNFSDLPRSPFAPNTNTITYAAPNQQFGGVSYSQRMSETSFPGDMHTLPVAVSGPSESAMRSSQPRQTSLARYRTTPYQHFRPIRPRPPRSSGY